MNEHKFTETSIKTSKSPLILGIISLVAWLSPLLGCILSIIGIVVSIKKMKAEKSTISKVGLILNILGLILALGNWIVGIILIMNRLQ